MMKMYISLDNNKILREKKYSLDKINNYLDVQFENRGMTKAQDGWYINGDFASCGAMSVKLSRLDWFMDNVDEWLWCDTSDQSVDDLKAFYSKEKAVG